MKKVYIKVTDDKLRLPVAIADTVLELAKIVGVTSNAIYSAMSHAKHEMRSSVYECVEIDEDEE